MREKDEQSQTRENCFNWFKEIFYTPILLHLNLLPGTHTYFLTQAWVIHCYIHPLGIICCEYIFGDQEKITSVPNFYLKCYRGWGLSELVGSRCIEFLRELIIEVRPRQASDLTCVVLAGTSKGLASPRVLVWTRCRCCETEWSYGIDSSENPS